MTAPTDRLPEGATAPGPLLSRIRATDVYQRDDSRRQQNADRLFGALDELGSRVHPDDLLATVTRVSATLDTEERAKAYILDYLVGALGFYALEDGMFVVTPEPEYELSADELAAWAALDSEPSPEPSPEPAKPVAAATEPSKTPPVDSGWSWNPADPIGSRQAWCSAMIPCKAVDTGPKVLAWLLSEKADTRTGIVYLTAKTIAEEFGRSRSVAEGYRAELRDAGYLVEAGWNSRGVKLWRLAIPACDCGKH